MKRRISYSKQADAWPDGLSNMQVIKDLILQYTIPQFHIIPHSCLYLLIIYKKTASNLFNVV